MAMRRRGLLMQTAVSLLAGCAWQEPQGAGRAVWPRSLVMATGSPGGIYAVDGPAWGDVVAEATGVAVIYRATQGAPENVLLTNRGAADLGMTSLGIARQAWTGTGGWTLGTQLRGIRTLFPMQPTPIYGVAPVHANLHSLLQLGGRTVGIGPADGSAAVYLPAVFRALGVHDVRLRTGPTETLVAEMFAGMLDACCTAGSGPVPAFAQAERTGRVTLLGLSAAQAATVQATLPDLTVCTPFSGAGRASAGGLTSVGIANRAIVRCGLPDDLVYAIVKSVLDQPAAGRAAIGVLSPHALAGTAAHDAVPPMHPGAARYFQAMGIALPAA